MTNCPSSTLNRPSQTAVTTRHVVSTATTNQNLSDAINMRRISSSSTKIVAARPNSGARSQLIRPVAPDSTHATVPPTTAMVSATACSPPRTEASWRSRTVSESPTMPVVTAVDRITQL